MRGLRCGRASRRWRLPSCSRISGSRRSMTWRARDSDEHTPIIRRAPLHCQCPKPKCSCSLRATASPRASTAWPATSLPSAISQPALRIVDDLLVATVAGCAGEDSATNLTAATQGRALLAMRYGGVLPGAATTAPAQHVSSVAAVERFISEIGAALERRGTEPSALRRVRKRIQAREANAAQENSRRWGLAS